MAKLIEVNSKQDILPEYRNTAISLLLEYHNLNKTFCNYNQAQILIGMCMDNRKNLWIPENFAFVIRSGGANLFFHEFQVSYAIGVGGVRSIALIGHNNCEMVKLDDRKADFISGMVRNAGWKEENAQSHFENLSPFFEIGNTVEFLLSEVDRLRKRYPKVKVAPLFFDVDSGKMSQIVPD
ncbi:carbonic anhydrase [Mangrovibacterium lignilyticum]|uniref:carbonic anhydrase n=1 Tax=Mangrovibacterium lignilyticum TaxID=2668052 RepID=UPI0013D19244|nr:carbonic anhydrase [Mangrovibacterium lignilyticum]